MDKNNLPEDFFLKEDISKYYKGVNINSDELPEMILLPGKKKLLRKDILIENKKTEGEKTRMNSSQEKIKDVLENMKDLLLYKNEKYGDSILSKEGQVFFKGDPKIRVAMHLDEKLSRIRNNPDGEPRKNDIMDLIGYLVFELIALDATREDFEKEMD